MNLTVHGEGQVRLANRLEVYDNGVQAIDNAEHGRQRDLNRVRKPRGHGFADSYLGGLECLELLDVEMEVTIDSHEAELAIAHQDQQLSHANPGDRWCVAQGHRRFRIVHEISVRPA